MFFLNPKQQLREKTRERYTATQRRNLLQRYGLRQRARSLRGIPQCESYQNKQPMYNNITAAPHGASQELGAPRRGTAFRIARAREIQGTSREQRKRPLWLPRPSLAFPIVHRREKRRKPEHTKSRRRLRFSVYLRPS